MQNGPITATAAVAAQPTASRSIIEGRRHFSRGLDAARSGPAADDGTSSVAQRQFSSGGIGPLDGWGWQ